MLVKRETIEKKVNVLLSEYNSKRKVKTEITKFFINKGFLPGDVNDIMSKRRPIETISDIELCVLVLSLYNSINEEDKSVINPEKLFNKNEMQIAEAYKLEKQETCKFPIIFENVIQVNDDQWISMIGAGDIAKLYSSGSIIYNPETQRNAKVKTDGDKLISEINLNKNSVQEIKNHILNNSFISNVITLNIQQDGEEEFEYNPKKQNIIINAGNISVLDGFHRSIGIIYAIQENPELQYVTELRITHFDVDKAKSLIVQEDKRNQISKHHIKAMDTNKLSNLIVKKLNENSNSYLRGKIATDKAYIKNGVAVVMFDVLSDMIEQTFKPKQNADIARQGKFILDGLNHIIDATPDYLEETNPIFWCDLVLILSKLYGKKDWKVSLDKILKTLDTKKLKDIVFNNVSKPFITRLEVLIDV